MLFSPRTVGLMAAVVTVIIWTSFIIIARASVDPARGGTLTPFDLAFFRIVGASVILLPWGWLLSYRDRAKGVAGLALVTVGILFGVRAVGPVAVKKEASCACPAGLAAD